VNGQHLRAFFWLRWRLRVNQMKRGGTVNAVILAVLAVGAAFLAVVLFVVFFLIGLFGLAQASPVVVMYVWDGVVAAFLFSWATGLVADLQRAEALSLDKFLHLPVSPAGAFLVNYLSSLLSINLIVFVPALVGLSLGLAFGRGAVMLLLLPLVAAFLLLLTALTYQFQGWLASLMANKRRRQTIIVLITAAFLLISQLPNLLNAFHPWQSRQQEKPPAQVTQEQQQQRLEQTVGFVNLVLPPGWLPLGALYAAEANVPPVLLAVAGLTLLGMASLWRSYRTTLRLYTGQYTSGRRRPVPAPPPVGTGKPADHLLEKRLPWLSEQTSAIALSSFRSLTRAPEGKMMLLTPLVLVLVFGTMFLAQRPDLPEAVRPLVAVGAMATILLSMIQLVGNQFGFDRSGFRVYVLCPAQRRDILLGKNLAFAPLALGLGVLVAVLVEVLYPMRPDYLLALLPQFVTMFLSFCVLANLLAILVPMRIAPGAFRPAHVSLVPVVLQLVFFFLFPVVLAPTLLPLGIELVLEHVAGIHGVPVCLVLSLLECVGVVLLYRLVLTWQGRLLQAREQKILEIVTTKAE
jgi:hypothetical protein